MNPKDRAGAKKPNLSVLPFAPLLDVIPALYEGRRKYGPWNWRAEEVSETIYADAAIRHLMQFISGEDIDPDSGVHHISKAIAGLLVVRDAQIHGCSIDDRYVNQNLQIDKQIEQLAGVNERYPEPVESALPPRDQGITGGETMTEEDAEKVAEYLGLREAAQERPVVEQVDSFDITLISEGDKVVFDNYIVGEIREIDEEAEFSDGLPICVYVEGASHWYSFQGVANAHDRHVQDKHKRIISIVSGNLTQTRLHFTLDKPTCGMYIESGTGNVVRWSAPQAGGGSYRLTKEDVGKRVDLRNGRTGKICAWEANRGWPIQVTVNDKHYTSTTSYGQSSCSVRDEEGFKEGAKDDAADIVKVYHQ